MLRPMETAKNRLGATSVVISTHSRADGVVRVLRCLARQTVRPTEVIIVDQSKGEAIRNAVQKALAEMSPADRLNVRHEAVTFQGLTKSRNHGLALVKTEFTTFIDDDVEIGDGYIEGALRFLRTTPGAQVVGGFPRLPDKPLDSALQAPKGLWLTYRKLFGLYRPTKSWKVMPQFEATFNPALTEPTQSDYISGSNFTVRTETAKSVWFDEKLIWYSIGEDLDFPMRVNKLYPGSVWIHPGFDIHHHDSSYGREYSEFLWGVHVCHHYYLFHKHWNGRISSAVAFAWSRLGNALMPALQHRRHGLPNMTLLMRSLKVEKLVIDHLQDVFKGEFPVKAG